MRKSYRHARETLREHGEHSCVQILHQTRTSIIVPQHHCHSRLRAFFRFSAPAPPVAALLTAFVVAAAAGTAVVAPATLESAVPRGAGEVNRSFPVVFSPEFEGVRVHVFGVEAWRG